jgi:hypothetical protein
MPLPSSINDLSTTPASNSPAGSESSGTADDYLRYYASYIAQLRDGTGFAGTLRLNSLGTAAAPAYSFAADTNTGFFSPTGDTVALATAGAEQMRMNATGMGLGITPASKLHVNGDILLENATYLSAKKAAGTVTRIMGLANTNVLYIGGIDSAQASTLFVNGGSTQMSLDSANNLTIANTSAAPSTPTGGGVLYVESGALKFRGSSGTITTIAAA